MAVPFRQKFPTVSVIVVGLANLSCSCDHYMNGENKPGTNWETKDSFLRINFVLETRDQTQPGFLSLSHSVGRGRREPWERGCSHGWIFCFQSRETRSSTLFLIACSQFSICVGIENQNLQWTVDFIWTVLYTLCRPQQTYSMVSA